MKNNVLLILLFFLALMAAYSCKESYEPAVIKANKNFLVVDGVINMGANAVTAIKLSRTRNVTDSAVQSQPEMGAQVSIKSSGGREYFLHEASNGIYESEPLNLSLNETYALQVIAQGSTYLSDYVTPKATPSVDSIQWTYAGDGVTLFANAHDPQNKTHYYRWEFTETWQYHSIYEAEVGVDNGLMYYVVDRPQDQRFNCWQTANSTTIMLGSSTALAQDVISHDSITHIPQNDVKIEVRYSILLRQYALDTAAYQYWQLLQKNTQQLGSLFDAQPTQLTGNVHNTTNASEPVLGYISASTIEEKRLFIANREVPNWNAVVYSGRSCDDLIIGTDESNFLIYNYPDPEYGPYYFTGGGIGPPQLKIARKTCLDCTLAGGTNQPPSFW